MKRINYKIILSVLFATLLLFSAPSCSDRLEDMNVNPNSPEVVPSNLIFSGATRYLMHYTRDGWWSARMTLPWMQYSGQLIYQEEDKYQYRETQTSNGWYYLYKSATDFKDIIDLNTDEETKHQMAGYGNSDNQIAVSRIMLAYIFDQLATHFGDVPYWSYGNDDPDFQALQTPEIMTPKFAEQSKIFADLLKELKEAAAQLDPSDAVFIAGDNIYNGDAEKWRKFANSLRLRIANRIKGVYPEAQNHISEAIAAGVFESNDDNAVQAFGTTAAEGSPFWQTFMVGRRQDFVVGEPFVDLLKGVTGDFGIDPRLPKMVAPVGYSGYEVEARSYTESSVDEIDLDDYVGMPLGLPSPAVINDNSSIGLTSFASYHVIKPDYGEVLMEYAEVAFILSEINGWDQGYYEEGVKASMNKWGVESDDIEDYINALPAASEENVITQKYIAFYMTPQEAWNEYRRTGFPDGDILMLPNGRESKDLVHGETYTFTPLISGNVLATDLPSRVRYPQEEQTLNSTHYNEARSKLSNGDEIDSKLWWAK